MPISEEVVIIRFPKELRMKVDRAAKKRRLTRSSLIRLAVSEWLDQADLKLRLEREARKPK